MIATTDVAGVSTQLAVLTYLFNPFRLRGRIVWAAREPIMVFGRTCRGNRPCTSYSRTNGYGKLRTNGYDIGTPLRNNITLELR